MKVVDEDVILQLRIPPPPLPLAWARTVMPYVPKHLYGKTTVPTVRGDDPAAEDSEAMPPSEQHVVPDIAAIQVVNTKVACTASHSITCMYTAIGPAAGLFGGAHQSRLGGPP